MYAHHAPKPPPLSLSNFTTPLKQPDSSKKPIFPFTKNPNLMRFQTQNTEIKHLPILIRQWIYRNSPKNPHAPALFQEKIAERVTAWFFFFWLWTENAKRSCETIQRVLQVPLEAPVAESDPIPARRIQPVRRHIPTRRNRRSRQPFFYRRCRHERYPYRSFHFFNYSDLPSGLSSQPARTRFEK